MTKTTAVYTSVTKQEKKIKKGAVNKTKTTAVYTAVIKQEKKKKGL